MLAALLCVSVALATLAGRRHGWGAPLTVSLWFWAGVCVVALASDLQLTDLTRGTVLIVSSGLVAMTLPAVVAGRRPLAKPPPPADRDVAWPRLVVCVVFLGFLAAVGFLTFRSRIAGVAGESFGNLTPDQIRAAQNGAGRGGGLAALCSAADPILAAVGIYGARNYSRLWFGAVLVAVGLVLASPARTNALALAVSSVSFYLYLRRSSPAEGRPRRSVRRWQVAFVVVVAVVLMAYYFNATGNSTNKNASLLQDYPSFAGPSWLLPPALYFTGGLSALSLAVGSDLNPFDHLSSIYSLAKLVNAVDPSVTVPDTIARYVNIPAPFNVYTGFGQLWFDFGIAGVIGLSFLLGLLSVATHRRALTGREEWAWFSAVLVNVLVSMQLEYRLFVLDVDLQLMLGFAIFVFLRTARRRGGRISGARRGPRPATSRPSGRSCTRPLPRDGRELPSPHALPSRR